MPTEVLILAGVLLLSVGLISIYQRLRQRTKKRNAARRADSRMMRPLSSNPKARLTASDMNTLRQRMQELSGQPLPPPIPPAQPPANPQEQAEAADLQRKLDSGDFESLRSQIHELADRAWDSSKGLWHSPFLLTHHDIDIESGLSETITDLLSHARQVTPGLSVPWLTPHVVVEKTPKAAGLFVVSGGWVTIKVDTNFEQDPIATAAILAHEVCHYILGNSSVRKSDRLENERYTDICMFVCGFGPIFLKGYRRPSASQQYRPGHRLGYMSDAEYSFVSQYVKRLRQASQTEN